MNSNCKYDKTKGICNCIGVVVTEPLKQVCPDAKSHNCKHEIAVARDMNFFMEVV